MQIGPYENNLQRAPRAQTGVASGLMPGAEPFIYGAGEVGCLLVHGFTSTPFEMRGLGGYLAERGITASAPLLAGHGTAPEHLRDTTWNDWYTSVDRAIDELRARCARVYVAGLSLGGALALYAAARRGGDIAGVVAMSAPVYLPPALGMALASFERTLPYLGKPFSDIEDPRAREEHVSYRTSSLAAIASLIEFLGPVRASLPHIKVPALVVYATHDHVVPWVSSYFIYSWIGTPTKRMLALHRGYHIMTVDTDREKLYRGVHQFIEEQELMCRPS
ncbi:MAG: alpha/beta hydrolase [Chloroflexia bacterium]